MALLAEAEKLRLELSLGPPGTPLIEIADAACEQLGFAGELDGQPVTRKIAACLERMGSGKEEPPPPPAALLMGEAVSDEAVLVGLPASAAVETSSGGWFGSGFAAGFPAPQVSQLEGTVAPVPIGMARTDEGGGRAYRHDASVLSGNTQRLVMVYDDMLQSAPCSVEGLERAIADYGEYCSQQALEEAQWRLSGLREAMTRDSQPDGVHSAKDLGGCWWTLGGHPHPCMCQGAWTLTPHGDDSFSICGFVMCFWAIPCPHSVGTYRRVDGNRFLCDKQDRGQLIYEFPDAKTMVADVSGLPMAGPCGPSWKC